MRKMRRANGIALPLLVIIAMFYGIVVMGSDDDCGSGGCDGSDSTTVEDKGLDLQKFDPEYEWKQSIFEARAELRQSGVSEDQIDRVYPLPAPSTPPTPPSSLPWKSTELGTGLGSCPYLYTWDGECYVFDNDIIPFKYVDDIDYYRIQQPLAEDGGYYRLRITEELPEISYLDFVRLLVVDHPQGVDVYPDTRGNIYNVSNHRAPVKCVDMDGNDCLHLIEKAEEGYGHDTCFAGTAGDYFTVDFGELPAEAPRKLVLTTDSPSSGGGGGGGCSSIHVQTQSDDGSWTTHVHFTTHEFWATNVIDVSGIVPDGNGDYRIRFYFTDKHLINYVGMDTSVEVDKDIVTLAPASAVTGDGLDITGLIAERDGDYAVMRQGDAVILSFPAVPRQGSDSARSFIFISSGYYTPLRQ